MKIAVFTDVHGNLKALKNTLSQIKEKEADKIIFLGDIFQRGNEEIECLEFLKNSGAICLKGNCELYLEHGVDIDPDVEYLRAYYDGMRQKISSGQMEFIRQMPIAHEEEAFGYKMHFSHFLFSDIKAPYPFLQLSSLKNGIFDSACKSNEVTKYDLVVVGHSHQNFENGNVVSVSAAGLEGASFLLIEATEGGLNFERVFIN